MAVDERCGSVVFAEEAAVDVVEPIPGNEPVPAGGTRETLWDRKRGTGLTNPIYSHTPLNAVHGGGFVFTLRWYTLPCALITNSLAGID